MGFGKGVERGQSKSGPAAETQPGATLRACPLEPEYHLHVDADRDGVVDDDRSSNNNWNWGPGSKGAIILCNNDADGKNGHCDNEDGVINDGADLDDIAPLVIRRVAGHPPAPPHWRAYLLVKWEDKPRLRIFASRTAGAPQVLGAAMTPSPTPEVPDAVHRWALPDLNFTELVLGVEAVMYPQGDFKGEIVVTLRIDKGDDKVYEERVTLRVAPWIAFNHLDKTSLVYIAATHDNAGVLGALAAMLGAAGLPPAQVELDQTSDRWMQDVMEIGFSSLPRTGPATDRHLPVVLRTAEDRAKRHPTPLRPLDRYPRASMLAPGFGFTQAMPPSGAAGDLDSLGNLECSPPFTDRKTGKEYKFGRMIYGINPAAATSTQNMQPPFVDFLKKQQIQKPFAVDTGWLRVGHVDEVFSFVPMKDAPKGFKVALVSPECALKILREVDREVGDEVKILQGILLPGNTIYNIEKDDRQDLDLPFDAGPEGPNGEVTLRRQNVKDGPFTVRSFLSRYRWIRAQVLAQHYVNIVKEELKAELDLEDSDFIELPVLFKPSGNTAYFSTIAYTSNVVNMLVLTKADGTAVLVVPKPFGPVVGGVCRFERKILEALEPTGVEIKFIDVFYTYHRLKGEIHCGTNSKREPPVDRWWWEQEVDDQ